MLVNFRTAGMTAFIGGRITVGVPNMDIETLFPLENFTTAGNGTLVPRKPVNIFFVLLAVRFPLESFGTTGITALIRSSAH